MREMWKKNGWIIATVFGSTVFALGFALFDQIAYCCLFFLCCQIHTSVWPKGRVCVSAAARRFAYLFLNILAHSSLDMVRISSVLCCWAKPRMVST